VSYAREELLKKNVVFETDIFSLDTSEQIHSSASTVSNSENMSVVSRMHPRRGREDLKKATQLLAQLSPTVLMKLLRRHDSTLCCKCLNCTYGTRTLANK